jgi:hypothetical protein
VAPVIELAGSDMVEKFYFSAIVFSTYRAKRSYFVHTSMSPIRPCA